MKTWCAAMVFTGCTTFAAEGWRKAAAAGLPPRDAYAGSWLGDGPDALKVGGITAKRLFLRTPPSRDLLRNRNLGREVNIWQYAPGDQVEVAGVRSL